MRLYDLVVQIFETQYPNMNVPTEESFLKNNNVWVKLLKPTDFFVPAPATYPAGRIMQFWGDPGVLISQNKVERIKSPFVDAAEKIIRSEIPCHLGKDELDLLRQEVDCFIASCRRGDHERMPGIAERIINIIGEVDQPEPKETLEPSEGGGFWRGFLGGGTKWQFRKESSS